MKCALMLVVVAITTRLAVSSLFKEPEDELTSFCGGSPDPTNINRLDLKTFDGLLLKIVNQQKTLVSSMAADPRDHCKYFIRVVTTWLKVDIKKELYYDWMGFSFGVHRNYLKFARNWVIGQSRSHIIQRGRTLDGDQRQELPYAFINTISNPPTILQATVTEKGVIHIRSNCPYAINWFPGCKMSTKWEFWIDPTYRMYSTSGRTDGMCGNSDGKAENDYRTCPDIDGHMEKVSGTTEERWHDISWDCRSGSHGKSKLLSDPYLEECRARGLI